MTARYEIITGVAVVTLDNPPVNSLGVATRQAVVEGIDRATADPTVDAIVIIGAGRGFSGGADIREFNTPRFIQEPSLREVLRTIESSAKPIVVAIHGTAVGGGLELALAAHYRVAAPGALVGLPEVKLGLLPGAGGTQRLPRAVGLETALNMILSGTPVEVERLAQTRLLDRVIEGDLLAGAVGFAREAAQHEVPHPSLRNIPVEHPNAEGFLEFARARVTAAANGYPAPLRCLDVVAAAVTESFDRGLTVEGEAFLALMEGVESKSLRHAFFGERLAARIPDVGADVVPRPVGSVGIIGAGTMGTGICLTFLNADIPVQWIESQQDALERGIAAVRAHYSGRVKAGKLTAEQVERRMGLLDTSLEYGALQTADLIVEAVYEDYAVKQSVLRKIDAAARPGAILATNTSTLDLNRIAAFTRRPSDVVGMHFFSPANVMKLLEVVRGTETSVEVLTGVMALARRIGKIAVVSGVCDGFIGNRMIEQYLRQAGFLLEEGALPQQVDAAIERFGFAMGPFRMSDLAGNDIGWAIRKRRYQERPKLPYSRIPDSICERGRFGQKSGKGWYDYPKGDRTAVVSQEVEDLVVEHSRELGMVRRDITDAEITGRLVYSLVNEGAKILEEGIAARASDIDMVYLYGYGFPPRRGGPMFYADKQGLFNVLRQMQRYASGYQGQSWEPATLLVQLADVGGTFNWSEQ